MDLPLKSANQLDKGDEMYRVNYIIYSSGYNIDNYHVQGYVDSGYESAKTIPELLKACVQMVVLNSYNDKLAGLRHKDLHSPSSDYYDWHDKHFDYVEFGNIVKVNGELDIDVNAHVNDYKELKDDITVLESRVVDKENQYDATRAKAIKEKRHKNYLKLKEEFDD